MKVDLFAPDVVIAEHPFDREQDGSALSQIVTSVRNTPVLAWLPSATPAIVESAMQAWCTRLAGRIRDGCLAPGTGAVPGERAPVFDGGPRVERPPNARNVRERPRRAADPGRSGNLRQCQLHRLRPLRPFARQADRATRSPDSSPTRLQSSTGPGSTRRTPARWSR